MSFQIHAKVIKKVYSKDSFYIWSCIPMDGNREVQINRYGNFSLTGELGYLSENKEYDFVLEEGKASKYGMSYTVVDCPSIGMENLNNLTDAEKKAILMDCTSSEKIADNILSAYPDFINTVLTEGKEAIDTKNIKGVGEAYLSAYARILNDKYKYFAFIHSDDLKDYQLTLKESKWLLDNYSSEMVKEKFKNNPYAVLAELGRKFDKSDELILSIRPELKESDARTEGLILDVLDRNEEDGSTRLNGSLLFRVCKEDYNCPELLPKLKNVAEESPYIYYDEQSKDLSKMATYVAECNVNSFVKEKLANSSQLDIDWKKYGEELSDEQKQLLKLFCENNFVLLTGSAGCVDRDTEYFNGKEWKKICDYTNGEKVLQYNSDGTTTLVNPMRYVKLPCNTMYHFETKYGLDQTISDDHTMIFDMIHTKGHEHKEYIHELVEWRANDFINLQNENMFNGNQFKFRTSFKYDGDGIDLSDDEIKLMCAVICDGTFICKNSNRCRFHIKKDRKKDELRKIFQALNLEYKEHESSAIGYTDFYVYVPRHDKVFTEYYYGCNNHQLSVICDNVLQWDGNVNTTEHGEIRKRFSTTIKQTADFIQFAFSACGYRATIKINDRRGRIRIVNNKEYNTHSIEYNVIITNRNLVGLSTIFNSHSEPTKIEKVKTKDGFKYCFTVPSHMLVLRRNNKIFITGNCGKTFSLKALINLIEDNGMTYKCLAPTGIASLRMSESINRPASTIHRQCMGSNAVINTDVLIVDECSMVDLQVFNMMLRTIDNPNIRIVLVGDFAQVLPIGVGEVFVDLINSNIVPRANLTKVFRYGDSGVLYVATNIRNGKSFNQTENAKWNGNECKVMNNYRFIQTDDDDILETAKREYMNLINKGIKKDNVIILSPFNIGNFGTYNLNNTIQAEVNPPKAGEMEWERKIGSKLITFRIDDRVINTKNDYEALTVEAYEEIEKSGGLLKADDVKTLTTQVFNGERGVIESIDDKKMIVKFGEQLIVYDKLKMYNLLLAYSISTHKSQGSEADYVINIISPMHKRMLNRNILYVADTRSKVKQIDIGSLTTFNSALLVDGTTERNTWLKELLLSDVEPHPIDETKE